MTNNDNETIHLTEDEAITLLDELEQPRKTNKRFMKAAKAYKESFTGDVGDKLRESREENK